VEPGVQGGYTRGEREEGGELRSTSAGKGTGDEDGKKEGGVEDRKKNFGELNLPCYQMRVRSAQELKGKAGQKRGEKRLERSGSGGLLGKGEIFTGENPSSSNIRDREL